MGLRRFNRFPVRGWAGSNPETAFEPDGGVVNRAPVGRLPVISGLLCDSKVTEDCQLRGGALSLEVKSCCGLVCWISAIVFCKAPDFPADLGLSFSVLSILRGSLKVPKFVVPLATLELSLLWAYVSLSKSPSHCSGTLDTRTSGGNEGTGDVFAGKFKFEWLPCWNRRGCACSEGACIGPSHDGACSGTGDVEADGARR